MPEGYGAGPLSRAVPYPPRARRSPLRRSMPYPPTPLPPAIPNWFLEAICDECGCDECGCDECGASGAAATHRHGHAGLYVGAGCHVTLQVQADRPSRPLAPSFWWSERGVAGYRKDRWARGNLRGGRPIPSLPASTRREAGSTHTLPLFLGSSTIPYRAKIRNPADDAATTRNAVNSRSWQVPPGALTYKMFPGRTCQFKGEESYTAFQPQSKQKMKEPRVCPRRNIL